MKRISVAVWHEKYERWQINVQKHGKRRSFYSSKKGREGQRECHRKADAWLDEGIISTGNMNITKLYEEWIADLKLRTSKGYWYIYEGYGKTWILPEIRSLKPDQITEYDLQKIIDKGYGKGLSKKYLQNISACMKAFFKYMRKRKLTNFIPEDVTIPNNAPIKEKNILQPDDLRKLFDSEVTLFRGKEVYEPYVSAFRFQVLTGLRPGEIVGLKWEDIDFSKNSISIKRAFNVHQEETTGKNDNAQRIFIIPQLASKILVEYKNRHGIDTEFVFTNFKGERIVQNNYSDRWRKYRDFNGISKISLYELRHTFISMVKPVPLALLKPMVGHSINMNTHRVYGHVVDGELELTADMINDIYSEIGITE